MVFREKVNIANKINDISKTALSVARILDRLDPGEYVISLVKPGRRREHFWSVTISRTEKIEQRTLGKR